MTRHTPIRADEAMLREAVIGLANRPSALLNCTASALLDTFGRDRAIILADGLAGAVASEDTRRKRLAAVTDCRDVLQISPALSLHEARAISFERDHAPPVGWVLPLVLLGCLFGLVLCGWLAWGLWDMQAEAMARQIEAGAVEW